MDDYQNGGQLSKPIAVSMLLMFRNNPDREFGTREIQRLLKIKSSSTTSSYLKKLSELRLVEKTPSNTYVLTDKGLSFDNLTYPVYEHIDYYKGKFVPKYSFLLSFILFSTIITTTLILLNQHRVVILINSLVSSLVVFVLVLREWLLSRNRYDNFLKHYNYEI